MSSERGPYDLNGRFVDWFTERRDLALMGGCFGAAGGIYYGSVASEPNVAAAAFLIVGLAYVVTFRYVIEDGDADE